MLPVVPHAITPIPPQGALVATSIPGSNVLRAPHDNVAPSVSSAQVNPDARGNSGIFLHAAPAAVALGTFSAGTAASGVTGGFNPGAPATFLAQILGQELSPAARGILVEYEKLISLSQVKYKPSNASLPPPEPAGLFGKILQQQKSVPLPAPEPPRAAPPSPAETIAAAVAAPLPRVAAPTSRAARTEQAAPAPEVPETQAADAPLPLPKTQAPPALPQAAIVAYAIGTLRNLLTEPPEVVESA